MKKVKKISGVNRLQLVDGNKLTAVLDLIKKDIQTKQTLAMLEKPDNFILEEKKNAMEKNNNRQGENIVEFVKNKNSLKRKIEKEEKKEGNSDIHKKKRTITGRLEDVFAGRFEEYLKKKNFKEKNGKIKIGRTSVNKEDLLYDISHMAEKPSSFNLRSEAHETVLKELRKTGMPATMIRNRKLREMYKQKGSDSSDERERQFNEAVRITIY